MSRNDKFKIRNMELYYSKFHALKNINIDIPEHQVTALIGPSGCGKSTFLRSLNRMNDTVEGAKVEGEILFDGEKPCSFSRIPEGIQNS